MSRLYFRRNLISDRTFENYLSDIDRLSDYKEVRDGVLPALLDQLEEQFQYHAQTFTCFNRFEGRDPTLRIQCPLGFLPPQVDIEFLRVKQTYRLNHLSQTMEIEGRDVLLKNLRVLLTLGWAHSKSI